jgi:hypothetical protein
MIRTSSASKLERHSIPEPMSGCWLWTADVDRKGYGRVTENGRLVGAHRLSYRTYVGPIPADICVCHRCDTPSCINPDHLWLGTRSDNTRDMYAKGRVSRAGEKNGRAKLTQDDVRFIRTSLLPAGQLASTFDVSRNTIWRARRGKNWWQS